jgi:integrase
MHILPYFGKKKLDQIKASDLARWQNNLLKDRSSKTVRTIRTVFQTIMEDAMMDEIIKFNPFKRVKAPILTESREKKPFLMDDMFKIIDAMPEHMKCYFAIGFFTGMRTGEIIGLQWKDVDWNERIIKVRRSRRQGVETKPKTKSSIRDVEILDALLPYLIKHRELNVSNTYIFETFMGQPFNTCDKISSHYWKPTLKTLEIPYRNLYQMRHSFASLMISNGEDILWVSNMLGHKDSSMTLEKYARYVKRSDKKRAEFLSK